MPHLLRQYPVAVEIRFTLAASPIPLPSADRNLPGQCCINRLPRNHHGLYTHSTHLLSRNPSCSCQTGDRWVSRGSYPIRCKRAGFTCIAYTIAIIIPLASDTDSFRGIAGTTIGAQNSQGPPYELNSFPRCSCRNHCKQFRRYKGFH